MCLKNLSEFYKHVPVLLKEVVMHIQTPGEGVYVDGTLGLGGHSEAILATNKEDILYGFEWNETSFLIAKKRLSKLGKRIKLFNKSFVEIPTVLKGEKTLAKGVLLDLGLSSFLLEDSERGFSFQKEEPLDMRMSFSYASITAKEILNHYDFAELERVFREGEVPASQKFAKFIIEKRKKKKFETTLDLVETIKEFYRPSKKKEKSFFALVFQALRIEVNQELKNLENALKTIPEVLKPGGRFLIITFHSLEDRLVKKAFKEDPRLKPLFKKPILPSKEEIEKNPRARSAKLRIAERV